MTILGKGALCVLILHSCIISEVFSYSILYFYLIYVVQVEQKTSLLLRLEEAIPPELMGFGMGEFDVSI